MAAVKAPPKNGMLDKLRQLSISDEAPEEIGRDRPLPRPHSSNYQLDFRPMAAGVRKKLWEEGYRYRNQRKMKGFRHEKIEWRLPSTERPPPEKHGPRSSRKKPCGHLREANPDYEPLFLPPTKLQMKSRRLKKLYEKKQQQVRRRPSSVCPEREDPESAALTSYARNKINNSKSHIAPPTYESSTLSLDSPVSEGKKRQETTVVSVRHAKAETTTDSPVQPRKTDPLAEGKKSQPRNAEVGIQVEHGRDQGS